MGGNTKKLRNRMKNVDSTLHLTKAMGLVASSKIRRAGIAMENAREYATQFEGIIDLLISSPESASNPYLAVRETNRTRLIVIAGDRGLAGGYNSNVLRLVKDYQDVEIIPIGKRACGAYGGETVSAEWLSSDEASSLSRKLCEDYINGEYDRLGIVGTRYLSMMSQEPFIKWVFPMTKTLSENTSNITFEPNQESLLTKAIPEYLTALIVATVRESFACEVAARRTAMDSAGKNAQEMIDNLQLEYNRARQGAITQELTEIVAGCGD